MSKHSWFWEGDKTYAVVGVSRNRRKFGNALFNELKRLGSRVYAVGASSGYIDGSQIYDRLSSLPEKPDRVVVSVKPDSAKRVVEECADLGIAEIWFQQGSFMAELRELCEQKQLRFVRGSCALLYVAPRKFPHNLHVWLAKLLGMY